MRLWKYALLAAVAASSWMSAPVILKGAEEQSVRPAIWRGEEGVRTEQTHWRRGWNGYGRRGRHYYYGGWGYPAYGSSYYWPQYSTGYYAPYYGNGYYYYSQPYYPATPYYYW